MSTGPAEHRNRPSPLGLGRRGLLPNLYDCIVFIVIAATFVLIAHAVREMGGPLARLDVAPVTLDPRNLPEYALRTTLRMFAAILASLAFTFIVATRSEERRVGKECRSRWSPYPEKKKTKKDSLSYVTRNSRDTDKERIDC